MLMDPNCMPQVLIYLRPEYFYLPQHKEIFSVMVSLDARQQDRSAHYSETLRITEHMTRRQARTHNSSSLRERADHFKCRVICQDSARKYHAHPHHRLAGDHRQRRRPDRQRGYASRRGGAEDIRYPPGQDEHRPSKLSDIIVNQVYDTLQKLSSEGAEAFKGISTGYRDLDDVIAGLNKSDLILIGARPAMGKTSFALNLARNVAVKAKKKILFFSLEMTKEQLAQRVLSTEARVLSTKMRTGQLDTDDWTRLGLATASAQRLRAVFLTADTIISPR